MSTSKLAFYTKPLPSLANFYELIDLSVKYGMTSYEGYCHLGLDQPNITEAQKIREYADKNNVTCCCFSLYVNIVGDNSKEKIEKIKRFVDVAEILGSPFIHHTVATGYSLDTLTDETKEQFFHRGIQGIREIYDYAATKNIRAVYEDQAFIFNGVSGFERLLNEVDRNIGIVADFGNIFQMNETIEPFIEKFHDRIVHVHFKDMKYISPDYTGSLVHPTLDGRRVAEVEFGTGDVNFNAAMDLLRKYNYNGFYSIERGAETNDLTLVDKTVEFCSKLVD